MSRSITPLASVPPQAFGHDLTRTVGRSTFFGVVANVVQMGTRLVTVPIVIHSLGLGGYGIWNIIMVTAAYMRFGSVGVKSAFQKYVSEATGTGDYETASKLLSTGSAVMLLLSITALIPISIFSRQVAQYAGVPSEFLKQTAGAVSLLALIMVISNVGAAFEAIVMGGHRIDLVRRFSTLLAIAEAVAIVSVLRLGYGLFAMSAVMGISEFLYISCCYVASRLVLPQVSVSPAFITKRVLYELFRFAGSYQLVNVLEILYASILPFAILRTFGANSAGVFAIVTRVVACALILQESFLSPILSSGAMVYASDSPQRMSRLLVKAFKVTSSLSFLPLGLIAAFGTTIAYVWTSRIDALMPAAFLWVCLTALFKSFSVLALVLYRVSGKALMDNLRQVLKIVILLAAVFFAPAVGFYGLLAGLALAEFIGMVFMLVALCRTFQSFRLSLLLPDVLKMVIATVMILGVGILVSSLPTLRYQEGHARAALRLTLVLTACAVVAWPSLALTGFVTRAEARTIMKALTSQPTILTRASAGE